MASVDTDSTTMAAPVSRSGQNAPNRKADLKPPCTTALGLLPFSAHMATTFPFWPTLVSSWIQISICAASGWSAVILAILS